MLTLDRANPGALPYLSFALDAHRPSVATATVALASAPSSGHVPAPQRLPGVGRGGRSGGG